MVGNRFGRAISWAARDPRYMPARLAQAFWQARSRIAARRAPLGEDILCRVLGRYDMAVSPADVGLAPFLISQGSWELWIARFMMKRIRPGMVCLDAGANVGYFTLVMADAAGAAGRVFAAEPIADTHRLLAGNVARNGFSGRVELVDAGLGDHAGTVTFIIPRGEPKNAMMQPEGVDYSLGRPCDMVTARMIRLDDLDIPRLDFAKVDVEAGEEALWRGMQDTLARSPDAQLVLEYNRGRCADPAGFLDALASRFRMRVIDNVGNLDPALPAVILAAEAEDVMLYLTRR